MREVIKTAPSMEEAQSLALKELGITLDRANVEVLEISEKGFIFKKKSVTVKVTEKEDEFDVKALFAEDNKPEEKAPEVKEVKKEQPKPAEKKEKAVKAEPKENKKAEAKKEEVKEEKPAPAPKAESLPVAEGDWSDKLRSAVNFLESILSQFKDVDYTLTPYKTETGYVIKITGDARGTLIGRKGETMEALSYLTGLAANRAEDSGEKITVDVADYRQKREKDLVSSAKKAAAKVLKTGRPFGFEPMNPYDRRIIHATIGEIEGVKSESKGEGSRRRVMVYSTNPKPKYNKSGKKDFNKGGKKPYNKGERRDRREKPAPQVQKTREEKLIDESSFGLYSKIDL